jgi:hypothetical protein
MHSDPDPSINQGRMGETVGSPRVQLPNQLDTESIARLFDVPESMVELPDWRRAVRARARISRRAEWDALVRDITVEERRNERRGEWRRMSAWLREHYAETFGALAPLKRPSGRPHLSECPSWYGEPCRCDGRLTGVDDLTKGRSDDAR